MKKLAAILVLLLPAGCYYYPYSASVDYYYPGGYSYYSPDVRYYSYPYGYVYPNLNLYFSVPYYRTYGPYYGGSWYPRPHPGGVSRPRPGGVSRPRPGGVSRPRPGGGSRPPPGGTSRPHSGGGARNR